MATRVKGFASLNSGGPPGTFINLPSTDNLVDIDSVQTVSNKTFVNANFSGEFGGVAWMTLDDSSATAPVSDPGEATVRYNVVTNIMEVSYQGQPYQTLGGPATAAFNDLQRKFRLLLKTVNAGLGLNTSTLIGIGGPAMFGEIQLAQATL